MGNKLKTRRIELGLNVQELAELSGLSTGYISNLENEQKVNPSKETMEKIANSLYTTVADLFF